MDHGIREYNYIIALEDVLIVCYMFDGHQHSTSPPPHHSSR